MSITSRIEPIRISTNAVPLTVAIDRWNPTSAEATLQPLVPTQSGGHRPDEVDLLGGRPSCRESGVLTPTSARTSISVP